MTGQHRPAAPAIEGVGGTREAALAVSSRRRLLEVLRTSSEPLSAEELAAAVALHVTTARHHLGTLERVGLVRRTVERAGRPGRPRVLYALGQDPAAEGYRMLAQVLSAELGADNDAGRHRAEQAGRRWAAQNAPAAHATSPEDALGAVEALFDQLGFAPRWQKNGSTHHLLLHACPFRDVARAHTAVVCSVHLGLLRGALDRTGSQSADARMRPFVEPELCIADVSFPANAMGRPAPGPRASAQELRPPT